MLKRTVLLKLTNRSRLGFLWEGHLKETGSKNGALRQ